jgi:hypothetical protein
MEIGTNTIAELICSDNVRDGHGRRLCDFLTDLLANGKSLTAIADGSKAYVRNLMALGITDEKSLAMALFLFKANLKSAIQNSISSLDLDSERTIIISTLPSIEVKVRKFKRDKEILYLAKLNINGSDCCFKSELLSPCAIATQAMEMVNWDARSDVGNLPLKVGAIPRATMPQYP